MLTANAEPLLKPLRVKDLHETIRVISITSGKGGVGKSSIVINLAFSLAKLNKRVLILDGDFGLANLDILLNIKPEHSLYDVLYHEYPLEKIIKNISDHISVIPASSGILKMTDLSYEEKTKLLQLMQNLEQAFDVLLIDTGAGIGNDVLWLNAAANEIIVVTTPEPTALADAYAMIKVLNKNYKIKQFKLLVNQVRDNAEGLRVYNNITAVADKFLNVGMDYLGCIQWDKNFSEAIRQRTPFIKSFPNSDTTKNFVNIATMLDQESIKIQANGNVQFFWKTLLGNA